MSFLKNISLFLFLCSILFLGGSCQYFPGTLNPSSLFSDHMVFQQNSNAPIWGTAKGFSKITIKGSWGNEVTTRAAYNGKWQTTLATPAAGGPYNVTISSSFETKELKNVMIGEVWLCAGQSNMEMPVKGWPGKDSIANSATEIAEAKYPNIRMFTMRKSFNKAPERELGGHWMVVMPKTVPDLSATAYFFARALQKELQVPIGLIVSSWGGTPVEAWIPKDHIIDLPDFKNFPEELSKIEEKTKALGDWLHPKEKIEPKSPKEEVKLEQLDFGDATEIDDPNTSNYFKADKMPTMMEAGLGMTNFDGTVLFKKKIRVSDDFLGKDLILTLGSIHDMDMTYFNGHLVGKRMQMHAREKPSYYTIPKELVKKEGNVLAIRVIDIGDVGGFWGDETSMRLHPKGQADSWMNIGGDGWYYLPIAEYRYRKFFKYDTDSAVYSSRPNLAYDYNANTPTVLYNGMIAPAASFAIKGAIWYQGEANIVRSKQYELLLPKLIESWRAKWKQGDFPFYYVQIAPYSYRAPESIFLGKLRDAQITALSVPNTGMAITMDIGNHENIHPANKQDVGKRLALLALAKDYGKKDLVFSGPIFKEKKIEGNTIRIVFQHANMGLMIKDNALTGFEIAGKEGLFLPATAQIDGNDVVVSNANILHPTEVRYAYRNYMQGTLFNKAGLPASSFSSE